MLISRGPRSAKMHAIAETFWCVHDATAQGYETLLPSARAQLIISLSHRVVAEDNSGESALGSDMLQVVQGPTTSPRRVSRQPQAALCGVSFCPGAASTVFGPLHHLTDKVIGLSRFWSESEASRFGDLLRSQECQVAVLDLLEAEIERRIADMSVQYMMRHILDYMATGVSLGDVAAEFGFSDHALRVLFLSHVGMTPKRFLRIDRFRATIAQLEPTTSLADLAYEQKFSDQAHMTREISHFASLTPRRLRDQRRPYASHVSEA